MSVVLFDVVVPPGITILLADIGRLVPVNVPQIQEFRGVGQFVLLSQRVEDGAQSVASVSLSTFVVIVVVTPRITAGAARGTFNDDLELLGHDPDARIIDPQLLLCQEIVASARIDHQLRRDSHVCAWLFFLLLCVAVVSHYRVVARTFFFIDAGAPFL